MSHQVVVRGNMTVPRNKSLLKTFFEFPENSYSFIKSIPRKTRFLEKSSLKCQFPEKLNFSGKSISRKGRFLEQVNFSKKSISRKVDFSKRSISQKGRFLEKVDFSKRSRFLETPISRKIEFSKMSIYRKSRFIGKVDFSKKYIYTHVVEQTCSIYFHMPAIQLCILHLRCRYD